MIPPEFVYPPRFLHFLYIDFSPGCERITVFNASRRHLSVVPRPTDTFQHGRFPYFTYTALQNPSPVNRYLVGPEQTLVAHDQTRLVHVAHQIIILGRERLFLVASSPGLFPDECSSSTPSASSTSTAEFIPIIRSFVHSPSSAAFARSLQGEEAREPIGIVDQAGIVRSQHSNAPRYWGTKHQTTAVPELNKELQGQWLHLLCKMCKGCTALPTSYTLQQGLLCVGAIRSSRGFVDVSTGDHLGCRVAISHKMPQILGGGRAQQGFQGIWILAHLVSYCGSPRQ